MNIFYLDTDPKIAAQYHNDKHCIKMILESAQLLSTAHRVLDGEQATIIKNGRKKKVYILSDQKQDILYQATHINHPCGIWCRASVGNYSWLYWLFVELCEEYTFRYGKTHKCETKLKDALQSLPENMESESFTLPALAMPEEFHCDDHVEAYRQYYIQNKAHLACWTKREQPVWWVETQEVGNDS